MLFRRKQEITHADTTVRARAKINLTLDVTGRREDGYHTVEMVMQSIALHDTVRVTTIHGEKKPRGIVLSCSLPFLPTDERNLAYRAAELFYKETGALLETCEIHIEKRIPVAAGLAGGSTDAAAVLRALNALHTAGLTDDELCEMGLKLGADVPFCLRGGTMLAQGIGDTIRVSLTGDPANEIPVAIGILKCLGLKEAGVDIVSCPTCGRTQIDLASLAESVETLCQNIERPLKIAVMGCVVNGPGEAREADIGIAGGKGEAVLFVHGEPVRKLTGDNILDQFMEEIDKL